MWDREIILTALKEMYGKDMDLFQEDVEGNFTHVSSPLASEWQRVFFLFGQELSCCEALFYLYREYGQMTCHLGKTVMILSLALTSEYHFRHLNKAQDKKKTIFL